MVELDLPLCRSAGTFAGICGAPGRHRSHRFLLQLLASRIRARTKDRALQGADAQDRYRRLLAREGLARLVPSRWRRRLRVQVRTSLMRPEMATPDHPAQPS